MDARNKSGHDDSVDVPINDVTAGLISAIHVERSLWAMNNAQSLVRTSGLFDNSPMLGGWVYIMTNRPNGTLYVGVTNDLVRRAWEHREGVVQGFTRRYQLKRLVYFERYDDIRSAIQREKTMKHWPRAWKVNLIRRDNPEWGDLYEKLVS